MKKVELLSPAGSKEALKAAIYGGCDAVYIGGKHFGARNYAENFTIEELEEAVSFAHTYDVKVYITVNTIIYEKEVPSFLTYIEKLVNIHIDALIMQDVGMIDLVKQIYPDLEIHASTQMNIHSLDGVRFIESLGIKRVVLARETDIDTIQKIKKNSTIEIEVFGHGALCMGYSGQCLMSYLIGKRSGNRGMCAGSCRQKYELRDSKGTLLNEGYLLSMKDLNVSAHLDILLSLGIDSIKIEGRMRKPSYIYFITSLYRKIIDNYYQTGKITITKEEIRKIYALYNRMFTKGYILKEKNENIIHPYRPGHMGTKLGIIEKVKPKRIWIRLEEDVHIGDGIRILSKKEDQGFTITQMKEKNEPVQSAKKNALIEINKSFAVQKGDRVIKTTDIQLEKEIENQIKKPNRKVEIIGKVIIKENQKMVLSLTDGKNSIEVKSKETIEKARKEGTTKEEIQKQLHKLGNTPFHMTKLEIEKDPKVFVPSSQLNILRREATSLLQNQRLQRKTCKKGKYERIVPSFPIEQKKGASFFYNATEEEKKSYDYIYSVHPEGKDGYQLPRIVEDYQKYQTKKEVIISEVGALAHFSNKNTDASFHVVNSYTLAYLHAIGVKRVTLSYEVTDAQIKHIIDAYKKRYQANPNVEVIVYGYQEAMITKQHILSYHQKEGYLIDKYKNKYYIKNMGNYHSIYHYQKKEEKEYQRYYSYGVNAVRFLYIKK